jgi:hypothetical protein
MKIYFCILLQYVYIKVTMKTESNSSGIPKEKKKKKPIKSPVIYCASL